MIALNSYILRFESLFGRLKEECPWSLTQNAKKIILEKLPTLGPEYRIFNNVAIHNTVTVDSHAILKGPCIISANCFVGAHTYLRGGVFLDEHVTLGPGCEIKSSLVFARTAAAHFNFIGDSIVGSNVNLEAGAIIANHYNERKEKNIFVTVDGKVYSTGVEKFGALVGDRSKVGANAVLSPGTILERDSIVKRLELVDQSA